MVVLEVMEELDDIRIIEALMDLDLTHQLHGITVYFEFRPLLDERRFLYDLNSEDILGVLCYEFVASGKSTLSEEVALDVLGNGVGLEAVILDYVEILVS